MLQEQLRAGHVDLYCEYVNTKVKYIKFRNYKLIIYYFLYLFKDYSETMQINKNCFKHMKLI